MKIMDLLADMRNVDISFRVIKKNETREISSANGKILRLSEVLVGDESGRIILALWDDLIDFLHENDIGEVKNGFVKVVKNELRLNIGKYGKLVKITDKNDFVKIEDIPDVLAQPPKNYKPPYKNRVKK